MSLKPYAKYKDSGVEWLGEVPEHWEVWKLSHACSRIGSGTTPKSDNLSYYDDGNIPWLNTGDLNDGDLFDCSKRITELAMNEVTSLRVFESNSIAIAMYGATIGKLSILKFKSTVNQACCVFEPSSVVGTKYLFYWLLGFREKLISLASGGGQPNISQEILRSIRLACPKRLEQESIVAFLDRETAKIDALIAEQEKLIALLTEKRQATISHAVTKGLNPTAKMKDSGVEWLGEVPEHWGTVSLKHVAAIQYGIGEPPVYREEGIPLIRATNVDAGRIREKGMVFVDPSDIPEKRIVWLQSGDIIVVRSGAYTGDSALVKQEHCPAIAGFDMVLRPHGVAPEFLQYSLLSRFLKEGQIDLQKMRAAQPHLNAEEIGSCVMLLPPAEEQSTIIETLNKLCDQIDALAADAGRAIDLLKERRTALISAAVTGKIDVRGVVEPEKAAA